jgi:transposase
VLDAQIAVLDVEIKTMITSDAELTLKTTVLKTLPGIADVTACALLAHMPEIGTLTTKEVASLAGVAPHPNQSGMKNGYRRTRGGRKQMRPVLFMAALSAAQSKSTLGVFYQRLLQNGKAKMCALVAVMRKMIVIANARIKEALAQYKNEQEKIMISA